MSLLGKRCYVKSPNKANDANDDQQVAPSTEVQVMTERRMTKLA